MKVGLTGNIGSGKTTVAKIFEQLNIPVFYADVEAKKAYYDPYIKEQVTNLMGTMAYSSPTQINVDYLAKKLFSNKDLLGQINQIIHPFVQEKWTNYHDSFPHSPYSIMEAAILHESGSYKNFDSIILVTAPTETRIERIIQRENYSVEEVRSRMSKQWSQDRKRQLSDFEIKNGENEALIPQVCEIHQLLCQKANQ